MPEPIHPFSRLQQVTLVVQLHAEAVSRVDVTDVCRATTASSMSRSAMTAPGFDCLASFGTCIRSSLRPTVS